MRFISNLVRRTDYISRLLHDVDEQPRSASAAPTMGAGDEMHRSVSAIDLVSPHALNPLVRPPARDPPATRRRRRFPPNTFRLATSSSLISTADHPHLFPDRHARARKGTAVATSTANTASSTGASSSPGTTADKGEWRNPRRTTEATTSEARRPVTSTPSTEAPEPWGSQGARDPLVPRALTRIRVPTTQIRWRLRFPTSACPRAGLAGTVLCGAPRRR